MAECLQLVAGLADRWYSHSDGPKAPAERTGSMLSVLSGWGFSFSVTRTARAAGPFAQGNRGSKRETGWRSELSVAEQAVRGRCARLRVRALGEGP
jgi:hypothetical protein